MSLSAELLGTDVASRRVGDPGIEGSGEAERRQEERGRIYYGLGKNFDVFKRERLIETEA